MAVVIWSHRYVGEVGFAWIACLGYADSQQLYLFVNSFTLQFRPISALHMVDKLVHYDDLSPLLPKNDTLTNMSDEDYEKFMDQWTESALAAPFVKEVVWAKDGDVGNSAHTNWDGLGNSQSSMK